MGKRSIEKHVKFNEEEYAIVSRKAERMKVRTGTYIRKIAVQGNIKIYDMANANSIKIAINRCGVNIDQIAKVANSTQSVYKQDVEDLQKEVKRLKAIVENWLSELKPDEII